MDQLSVQRDRAFGLELVQFVAKGLDAISARLGFLPMGGSLILRWSVALAQARIPGYLGSIMHAAR